MGKHIGKRIYLTVPDDVYRVLGGLADELNSTRSSIITGFLIESLPAFSEMHKAAAMLKRNQVDALKVLQKALDSASEHASQLSLNIKTKRRAMARKKKTLA